MSRILNESSPGAARATAERKAAATMARSASWSRRRSVLRCELVMLVGYTRRSWRRGGLGRGHRGRVRRRWRAGRGHPRLGYREGREAERRPGGPTADAVALSHLA